MGPSLSIGDHHTWTSFSLHVHPSCVVDRMQFEPVLIAHSSDLLPCGRRNACRQSAIAPGHADSEPNGSPAEPKSKRFQPGLFPTLHQADACACSCKAQSITSSIAKKWSERFSFEKLVSPAPRSIESRIHEFAAVFNLVF